MRTIVFWTSILYVATAIFGFGHVRAQAPQGEVEEVSRILYTRFQWGIYIDQNGDVNRVGWAHGHYVAPRFIPGNKDQALFHSMRRGPLGIWLQDLNDIDGRERLCDGHQAAVSPDGTRIAFIRDGALMTRRLDDGAEQVLLRGEPDTLAFPWFVDNGRLIYVERAEPNDRLMLLPSLDGNAQAAELLRANIASGPRASRDGRFIAYPDDAHIHVYDMQERTSQQITYAGGVQSWPMWSAHGTSVAYVQSNTPHDGPWNVHNVALDNLVEARQLLNGVMHAPDWNGIVSEDAFSIPVKTAGLDAVPGEGGHAWQTPWGTLSVNRPQNRIVFQPAGGEPVTLSFIDEAGQPVDAIAGVSAVEGPGSVAVTVDFRNAAGAAAQGRLNLSTWRPMVTAIPGNGLSGILVERAMKYVVVPDRLADDIVLPGGPSEADRPLPPMPIALGLLEPSDQMLVAIAPGSERQMTLTAAGALRIRTGAAGATIAAVSGRNVWRELDAKPVEDGIETQWANDLAGQWRLALRQDDRLYSMTRDIESPTRPREWTLELAEPMTPQTAVTYLFGRLVNTPLDVVTPLDIVYDALGMAKADTVLDTEGVRRFRHADVDVPFKHPEVALQVVGWMMTPDRPGVKEKMDVVFGDLLTSLNSLEVRAADYAQRVELLKAHVAQAAEAARRDGRNEATAFLDDVAQQITDIEKTAAETKAQWTPLAELKAETDAFVADPPGGGYNMNKDVYKALEKRALEEFYAQRAKTVDAYRFFFQCLANRAGLQLAGLPAHDDAPIALRQFAHDALRHRYFLEMDWRGETYLSNRYEVPLEAVTTEGLTRGRGR